MIADDWKKVRCTFHISYHLTSDCRVFCAKTFDEWKEFLMKHGQCFKCFDGKHLVTDFHMSVKYGNCGRKYHCTAMHANKRSQRGIQGHGGGGRMRTQTVLRRLSLKVPTKSSQLLKSTMHVQMFATFLAVDLAQKIYSCQCPSWA